MIDLGGVTMNVGELLPAMMLLIAGALLSVIPEAIRALFAARGQRRDRRRLSAEHMKAELVAMLKTSDILCQQPYFEAVAAGDHEEADRYREDALIMAEAVDTRFATEGADHVLDVGAASKTRYFYAKRLIVAVRLLMKAFKERGEDRSDAARKDAVRILRLMKEARSEIAAIV
ncbi:MAG: hypothetical protein MRY63_11360 [Neomegalonema sp.]|nr:hypothetical protein [Neomegalonema sp.]